MQTIEDVSSRDETFTFICPLCGAPLPAPHPAECSKCDWVAKSALPTLTNAGTFRDRAAVALSVWPGLGHLYKGHKLAGVICTLGAGFAILGCAVAGTFTAGFGILLLPLFWVGSMLHAYSIEDWGIAPAPKLK